MFKRYKINNWWENVSMSDYADDPSNQLDPMNLYLLDTSPLVPVQIKDELDRHVIGQDHAKVCLSVASYNRHLRMASKESTVLEMYGISPDVVLEKYNILMLGPTGCGKTLLVKQLGKILDCPVAELDATSLTCTGYVGEGVLTGVGKLLDNSIEFVTARYGTDIGPDQFWKLVHETVSYGIIYIDEIDKITGKDNNGSIVKDVNTTAVQVELLKIIEGCRVDFSDPAVRELGSKYVENRRSECVAHMPPLYTSNILFILSGSFHGIESIISNRMSHTSIGFYANLDPKSSEVDPHRCLQDVTTKDLVDFGIMPELVGRMGQITVLDPLDEKDLVSILTEPVNSIVKQYKLEFQLCGKTLEFSENALLKVAKEAKKLGTGARALRNILQNSLLEKQFTAPSLDTDEFVMVDEDMIKIR